MFKTLQDPKRRGLVVSLLVTIVVACVGWIVYGLASTSTPVVTNVGPSDPLVIEAQDLTSRLRENPAFDHLEIFSIGDNAWKCSGEVKSHPEIEAAKSRSKDLKPDAQWEFEIVPLTR